jgi:hypothetical protein
MVLAAVVLIQCQVTLIALVVVVAVCVLDGPDDRVDDGVLAVLMISVLGLLSALSWRGLTATC